MGLVEVESGTVAGVLLSRSEQRNAMSLAMLEELAAAFGSLAVDPEVRVIVLSGRGPDFCAGADLADVTITSAERDYGRTFEQAVQAVLTTPCPVISMIQGAALGAGCQIAVACDLAVAAEDARLGIPSGRLGLLINFENIQRLVLAVGPKRAGEILFTARSLSGIEAASWGLVNRAVPARELEARTLELAEAIARLAPLSIRGSKRGIGAVLGKTSIDRFTEGHRVADFDMMYAEAFASEDLREGIKAFRERREPRFEGR